MKPFKFLTLLSFAAAVFALAVPATAQLVAYDDAGNYLVTANWTNGANQGSGFTPWVLMTNGPDFHGTYVTAPSTFVIASSTNILGTNYSSVWGTFANGTNDVNETVAYRGFINPLGTNTFKLQWGSRGAGVTTTVNSSTVHGWCGFTLRSGNDTNSTADFQSNVRFYLYFLDGASPSTLYVWDGNGVQSVPGTSFSDLGRQNVTNAIQAEVTPGPDGTSYHLVLKDCVVGRIIYTLDSSLIGSGTIDSAALFCHETTGDQVYNRMQIAVPHIPPSIVNLQPTNGSIFLDAGSTSVSFEIKSLLSTVVSNAVSVSLNGVLQSNLTFSAAGSTNDLLVNCGTTITPDTFYNCIIIVQDANGDITTNVSTFNTFLTTDTYVDAYDYNYNFGQFVSSLTPSNSYANLLGTNGVDYFISDLSGTNNTAGYRPGDLPQILPLNTDATGDPVDHANLRANGYTAYNIGFTDTGNWENYTRVMPATNYSIYARAASVAGGQFEVEKLANSTATTTNQPLAALGRVNVPATGGSKVFNGQLIPLTDFSGNPVVMPFSGTTTLRTTAVSSRSYNFEYLMLVAVPGPGGVLRPYIATGSPVPNASGVSLTSPISFSIANRQTTAPTNNIQMFLNSTNVSSRLVINSNLAGVTVAWTPTNNFPANFTNLVVVIFTDSAGVNVTNSWKFITGTAGGILGNGLWTGGGGTNDMLWADGVNWTNGTPGPGFAATFSSPGATTTLVTNNMVATNVVIQQLNYQTNNSGFHTTWIQDGVTLTVTNASTAVAAAVQVGVDVTFNKAITNTITGLGGTLLVQGNSQSSGLANQLNFQVRQCASPAAPNQTTLDMSGLGTLIATVGKFYVAQGGNAFGQSNVSGCVFLARTNIITCLRANAGQFEVGDSSSGTNTLPGSALYLGITNALFVDTMRFGKNSATNNIVRFNPAFTNIATPAVFIRGTNGLTSRLSTWTIGDADTEPRSANFVQANVDFSGGKVDALIGTMIIGRGETVASDTGYAQGTLTLTAGTLDVNNLTNGVQRANNTATESGVVNINGTAALVSTNIILAQAAAGANAALVSGTLNITNGTVRGNIIAGGGVSTVNISGGTLVVSNAAGTSATPLTALNLASASVHLKVDGNNTTTAPINATAVSASGTTITIDSVANVTGPKTIHLISYSGTDPYIGLSLAPLPSGYAGSLADNSGNIDLNVNVFNPVPPTIRTIAISGGQVIIGGTNNSGAGGTYAVLVSTNLTLPRTNWTVLSNGSFDGNGNFFSTNSTGTNSQRFFMLRVP